ncbi:MAG: hypothetical protein HYX80_09760 [Chloroflexi bacterium]|nr:hypothetical protein [Chloroflexota bacterium]
MTTTAKKSPNRSRYFLDLDPKLRNHVKAAAALRGITMKEWLTEAITEKLEDEIDGRIAEEAMADTEGTISLEDYIKSRKKRGRSGRRVGGA